MIRHMLLTRSPTRPQCLKHTCVAALMRRSCAARRAASTLPSLRELDRKWQARWQHQAGASQAAPGQAPKAYVTAMFPYPSGALHMGHLRVYTVTDVLARFKHMQGYDVLYPMGWDAFGLPAENAAIDRGVHPADWTKRNTENMKSQLQAMNGGMDWSKEFMTCSPEFYKHTQRLFLLLHEHGLAYQAESVVNYDPVDRTVLANEQVDSNGHSWRSGAKVERLSLKQWFLKISAFRDALLDDLELLSEQGRWPERVIAMQRHWIGKSDGANIKFEVSGFPQSHDPAQFVEVFTTRPDTLFGVQYLALSMSHPLVRELAARHANLAAFIDGSSALAADSKVGYQLPGVFATSPLSRLPDVRGFPLEPIPVFVAPYVLDEYGSGAVMGVPGHDTRDHAFWTLNRPDEAVRRVVLPSAQEAAKSTLPTEGALTSTGFLSAECSPFAGLSTKQATERIIEALSAAGEFASKAQTWRLRDWLVSRQRYWGCPIPIIHCKSCGAVPVPSSQLPVKLPDVDGTWFKGRAGNPLEEDESWHNTICPSCGSPAKRDTDTMDTFVDSSWYFFRFADAHNETRMFDPAKIDAAMPMDVYVGGIEHAILHLLYARFVSKFLASIGEWPSGQDPHIRGEPFTKLLSQGMVHGKTFSDPQTGRFLKPDELDMSDPTSPKVLLTGEKPTVSFEKMSKSKHNGVDPSAFIDKHGADVTRAHVLFQAPVTDVLEWEEDRVVGVQRWLQRVWHLVDKASSFAAVPKTVDIAYDRKSYNDEEVAVHNALRATAESMTEALDRTYALNTCISDLMQLTNIIYGSRVRPVDSDSREDVAPALFVEATRTLVLLLAPFAPAFASESWEHLCLRPSDHDKHSYIDVFSEKYPTAHAFPLLAVRSQTVAVMQNGKLRFTVDLAVPPDELLGKTRGEELTDWTLIEIKKSETGAKWLNGKEWKRIIVAKGGKTINFVG